MAAPCIVLPPARIGPRRKQTDDERPTLRGLEGFPHPPIDFPAIGRIDEDLAFPALAEAVVFPREVACAFGVLGRGARVEREAAIDPGQLVKERLRRFPFDRRAGEMNVAV